MQGLPPPVGIQAAAIPPYDPNAPIAPPDPFAVPPVSPAEFGGPYATPVDAPPPALPPLANADENDDAVDEVDRIFGADALPVTAPGNDDLFAPPSQPIATQRLREGDPGSRRREAAEPSGLRGRDRPASEPTALDLRAGRCGPAVLALVRGELVGPQHGARRRPVHARHEPAPGDRRDPRGCRALVPAARPRHARRQVERPADHGGLARDASAIVGNLLPAIVAVLVRVFWGGVLLWLLSRLARAPARRSPASTPGSARPSGPTSSSASGSSSPRVIAIFGYGFVAPRATRLQHPERSAVVGVDLHDLPAPRHRRGARHAATAPGCWCIGGAVHRLQLRRARLGAGELRPRALPASRQFGRRLHALGDVGATLPPFVLIAWGAMLAASDPRARDGARDVAARRRIARLLPALVSGSAAARGRARPALGHRARRCTRADSRCRRSGCGCRGFAGAIIAAVLVGGIAAVLLCVGGRRHAHRARPRDDPRGAGRGVGGHLRGGDDDPHAPVRQRRSLLARGGVYPHVRS